MDSKNQGRGHARSLFQGFTWSHDTGQVGFFQLFNWRSRLLEREKIYLAPLPHFGLRFLKNYTSLQVQAILGFIMPHAVWPHVSIGSDGGKKSNSGSVNVMCVNKWEMKMLLCSDCFSPFLFQMRFGGASQLTSLMAYPYPFPNQSF